MIDGPLLYRPGEPVPFTGTYAAVTLSGHPLGECEVLLPGGQKFPPAREIAGPGVEVRFVLVRSDRYLRVAS